jgi:ubiquinone/menaquinone biosynthesis C-methylase UbiE
VGILELMDGPLDMATLAGNLRDLVRINRWLGGTRLSTHAVARLLATAPPSSEVSLLDIGTGAADIPASLIERFEGEGIALTVTAADERGEMLHIAADRVGSRPGLSLLLTSGGSRLPFPDGSFDIAHCSLMLHHLEPDEATDLLREAARVSRLGVIVNDLDRATRFWLGAWLISHLTTRNRYTRHDAPLSVRRAYRPTEAEQMATSAGLTRVAHLSGFMGHRYALVFAPHG